MPIAPTVFAPVMDFLPIRAFRRCVQRYRGNHKVQSFTCLDRFFCTVFAQLTYRESLRDIETCLRVMQSKLYHMGIRGGVARSTLADADENRDWRIHADVAQVPIAQARPRYANEDLAVDLEATVYALDSSPTDLCLSLFPWARFRRAKAAVKLHTRLNLRGSIPEFIPISDGKLHDVNVLDILIPQPGSFHVMDRGHVDFARLYALQQAQAFFVTRAKRRLRCQRRYSRCVDKDTGLRCDRSIMLTGVHSTANYPEPLRRIRYVDLETGKGFVFLANDFSLPPLSIALLYKARWRVEPFFKWIKQHLRIKAF